MSGATRQQLFDAERDWPTPVGSVTMLKEGLFIHFFIVWNAERPWVQQPMRARLIRRRFPDGSTA